ncbi:MAG: hypothetical protein QM813_11445 [Verrucomicrobiota bacterium]
MELELSAPDPAPRKLVLYPTQAPDYARLRFSVDRQVVTPAFDGYTAQVQPAEALVLGVFPPRDGKFIIRAEVIGANPAAQGAKS